MDPLPISISLSLAAAAKSFDGFDVGQAVSEDKRAFWAYRLLDAQGSGAVVRPEEDVILDNGS